MKRQKPQAKRRPAGIEKSAFDLIERIQLDGPPLNVHALARKLGVRITKSDLGDDCSGVLVKKGDSAVIGVNWEHHSNRQRFTIAHELGHFILHDNGTYVDRGKSAFFRNSESGSGTLKQEREANRFAAALLMPADWIHKAIADSTLNPDDELAVDELATQFEVSTQAMLFRLVNLGLTTREDS